MYDQGVKRIIPCYLMINMVGEEAVLLLNVRRVQK